MTHYPVTTGFYRGVWDYKRTRQPLRRACDWRRNPDLGRYSYHRPTCPDCAVYRERVHRGK